LTVFILEERSGQGRENQSHPKGSRQSDQSLKMKHNPHHSIFIQSVLTLSPMMNLITTLNC